MGFLAWNLAIEAVEPHIVRIETPRGSGTGFLVSTSADGSVCAIATAAHVIAEANYWECYAPGPLDTRLCHAASF